MQLNTILVLALFIAGVSLVIFSNFIVYIMIGEINGKSEPKNQISMFFLTSKWGEILNRHRALYPQSHRRRQFYIVGLAGIAMGFAAFVVLILAKSISG